MKIIEINEQNRIKYDEFVESHLLGSIHQIFDWGIFQGKSGLRDKFWVVAAVEDGSPHKPHTHDGNPQILASALVIRQKLPFGKCWLYCPRGPLGDYQSNAGHEALKSVLNKIREIGHRESAVFFRFDPPLEDTYAPEVEGFLHDLRAVPAHAHYQPESTLILDLKHEPEDLLKKMKPKGRYNIKVAQKHGVTVRVSAPYSVDRGHSVVAGDRVDGTYSMPAAAASDLEAFFALLRKTTARDGFSGHPLSYYRNMLETLGPKRTKLYLAEYEGKLLAGMISTYFGQTATYYFGASSDEHRNTMAPYLLHWQAINDARAAGYHYYDFFGIAPENQTNHPDSISKLGGISKMRPHPWAKVTEFKLKFGGERVNYLPAREIIYKPFWYALIKTAKWARGILHR
jgi:peptidoglycan pentaglycine glycine transferase (the first glycine)